MTADRNALAKLVTEFWRLMRITERVLAEMPADKAGSAGAQLRYSSSRLAAICAEGGLNVVVYDGQDYEPNLPVTIANAEEAAEFSAATIERTVEPTIVADGQIITLGKVLLKERA